MGGESAAPTSRLVSATVYLPVVIVIVRWAQWGVVYIVRRAFRLGRSLTLGRRPCAPKNDSAELKASIGQARSNARSNSAGPMSDSGASAYNSSMHLSGDDGSGAQICAETEGGGATEIRLPPMEGARKRGSGAHFDKCLPIAFANNVQNLLTSQ